MMKTLALVLTLSLSTPSLALTCEQRAEFAKMAAEHSHLPFSDILHSLHNAVRNNPDDWTTAEIQYTVAAIAFGYRKEPNKAYSMELAQCRKEVEL